MAITEADVLFVHRRNMRTPKASIVARILDLKPWNWSKFSSDGHGLTYHTCRFCRLGAGEIHGLWKYGVRHHICEECRVEFVRRKGRRTTEVERASR